MVWFLLLPGFWAPKFCEVCGRFLRTIWFEVPVYEAETVPVDVIYVAISSGL